MKKIKILLGILIVILSYQSAKSQNGNQAFKMLGTNPEIIEVNKTFTSTSEISPFSDDLERVYGLAINANIILKNDNSLVRVIFIDKNYEEHLVYEVHSLLEPNLTAQLDGVCEETGLLNSIKPRSVRVEVTDASITIVSLTYANSMIPGTNVPQVKKDKKQAQNNEKIARINETIAAKGRNWIAGPTGVSELSYAERKKLYGQGNFPPGFEFYSGGVIQAGNIMKSLPSASPYVDEFDWRNRHGENWISPVTNQASCGSCWAFAATGATEAIANVYYNLPGLNLNLSEQDVLSCSGAGDCGGGYPSTALYYISQTGVVDEATFPYTATDQPCENKGTTPNEKIKIAGRINFGVGDYPRSEDGLKKMIIEKGPISGGLYDWSHAMVLAGYMVVEEGDNFYTRDPNLSRYWVTVGAGSPLIGKTVWIFKNSWGSGFGDSGYVYVQTDMGNFGWTHALTTPVQSIEVPRSVQCTDNDNDGYFWWGLGAKPASCPSCPDTPDGDDSDPTLGPLDEFGHCTVIDGTLTANFAADKTNIFEGEQVTFANQSTGGAVLFSWSFPGGSPSSSSESNPTIVYAASGTYSVSLTVYNSIGESDELVKANHVIVSVHPPVADFIPLASTIAMGESISFMDKSGYNPTSFSWTFNGGNPASSIAQNQEVSFNIPGTYAVSLTVTNAGGSDTKTGTVTVIDPSVINYCPSQGLAANEWIATVSIGDMFYSSGNNNAGHEDFTEGPILSAELGETLDVNMTPGFNPRSKFEYWCIWIDFDKSGEFDIGERLFTSLKNKSAAIGTLTIPAGENTGEYRMRISMSRDGLPSGCGDIGLGQVEDYAVIIGEAVPKPPVADFSADKRTVEIGEVVTFIDKSTNNPDSRLWTFPGGVPGTSTDTNPVITYNTIGDHDVSLVVTKAGFAASEELKPDYITVLDVIPPDVYCVPTGINSSSDYIKNATIDGVMGGITSGDGYSHSSNPVSMNPGTNYNLSMTPNLSRTRNFWRIWIDFDQNGSFDPEELLLSRDAQKGSFSGSIYIPEGAIGVSRLRISMRNNAVPSPCSDGFKGEVEDYTVNFGAGKSGLINSGNSPSEQSLLVYPNPSSDYLFVRFRNWDGRKNVRLMDMTGRTLLEKEVMGTIMEFDLSSFPKGIYLIDVNDDFIRKTKKISKL